jgi:hypothetical protein
MSEPHEIEFVFDPKTGGLLAVEPTGVGCSSLKRLIAPILGSPGPGLGEGRWRWWI